MFDDISKYPLTWPDLWPRTKPHQRQVSAFADRSVARAIDFVLKELDRLGASSVIISSNLQLRRDGLPMSTQRRPDDPGIAVYFRLKGEPRVLACDKWTLVEDNLWAIGKHIEAVRGQQRWGVGTLEQAFAGYAALPAPAVNWWEILRVNRAAPIHEIRTAYHDLAKQHHPDAGGDQEQFIRIQQAWELAQKEKDGQP